MDFHPSLYSMSRQPPYEVAPEQTQEIEVTVLEVRKTRNFEQIQHEVIQCMEATICQQASRILNLEAQVVVMAVAAFCVGVLIGMWVAMK